MFLCQLGSNPQNIEPRRHRNLLKPTWGLVISGRNMTGSAWLLEWLIIIIINWETGTPVLTPTHQVNNVTVRKNRYEYKPGRCLDDRAKLSMSKLLRAEITAVRLRKNRIPWIPTIPETSICCYAGMHDEPTLQPAASINKINKKIPLSHDK